MRFALVVLFLVSACSVRQATPGTLSSAGVPERATNCGSQDPTYNAQNGVGETCWDAKDEKARCYLTEEDGSHVFVRCDDATFQACPGGLGSGCGLHGAIGGLGDVPCVPANDPSEPYLMQCIVGVGSILHDQCCAVTDATGQPASGCKGDFMIVPGRACDAEWREAIWDRTRGFVWWRTFDTRERHRSVTVRALLEPEMLDRFGLRADANQELGGTRITPLPGNLVDEIVKLAYGARSRAEWGQFCKSGDITNTWAAWITGIAYCK